MVKMSSSRKPSPARSQGTISTPRREKPRRTRSVGSPAHSDASGRLSSIIQEHRDKNVGSLVLSPLVRKSVLTDNTDIEEPTRKSWWKKLDDNSRDVMEVLEDAKAVEFENIFEELGIELRSPEKKNYSLDIPDSSDNESIKSIVLPQKKLFAEKENLPQKKFGHFGTRETLDKLYKTNVGDNTVSIATKELFQSKPRSKPIFLAALLNTSPNSTKSDKTLTDVEPKAQVRNIFGRRQNTKRKNMFANFIASESEDEISEIHPKVFAFQKSSETKRCPSSLSRGIRDASPTSSVTTDMELDDWKLLPSSTLVETQLDFMIASGQTPKKAKLCNLSEGKESEAGTSDTQPVDKTIQLNKSTSSKNKSKTMTKEKSPELDSSISTRNKSKKSQNEDMSSNKSQGKLNKSQPTSLINNDSDMLQSSIATRSKNKSDVVDAKKDTSTNKSQNSGREIENAMNNFLKQTENYDKATDMNNLKSISKNGSNIHSFSESQNVIAQEEQNSVNVTDVEMIAQNEEELNFTLEYESDANADEINVVKNSNFINQSNKINVSKKTSKKDIASDSLPTLTNKIIDESLDIADQDGCTNANNTKVNSGNCLQIEDVHKGTTDNDNHEETNNEAKINKYVLGQQNQSNNEERRGEFQDNENNKMEVEEMEQNISVNVSQKVGNKNRAKNENIKQDKSKGMMNLDVAEQKESRNKTEELENENSKNCEQNQEIEHEIDQEVENHYIGEDEGQQNEILENESQGEEMKESLKVGLTQDNECEIETNESKEGQMESQEVQSKIQTEQNENQEELTESQDKLNDSQEENESDNEPNNSQVIEDESEEEQSKSQEKLNESQEEKNEREEKLNESQEESNESEEELDNSQEIKDNSEEEHNDSQEIENETEEPEMESEAENEEEENGESQEVENESENEQQNISQEEIGHNESEEDDQEMECDVPNESIDNEAAADIDQDESQENNEEAESDLNEIAETPNVSHDTTGRNRKKHESPEIILHDTGNQIESFTVPGRNTSIRKSKSITKNLNIRPSFAPNRESTGLSDGTKNSSTEGSGWDSHRTTRKTLRQTFGKDFTPRKSLRALVMEKSAKRQTVASDITSVTAKFPLANSTELPDGTAHRDGIEMYDEPQQSDHEASRQMRQTTLEIYLQKIKQQNMENRIKIDEAVRNSLKVKAPPKDIFNPFKVPSRPMFPRKTITKTTKPKVKSSNFFINIEELPDELKEDMKYKPPKRFQPSNAAWITKRLYKYLEIKLEPKYDYKARVRAEKLVENLYNFAKELRRRDVASTDSVDVLKHEFARLNIVKTHFDFYNFFHEFMPREIRIKVIPDVVNKIPPPRRGVFYDRISEKIRALEEVIPDVVNKIPPPRRGVFSDIL